MDVYWQLTEINGLHQEFQAANTERDDQRVHKNNGFHLQGYYALNIVLTL